jgi:hypothetical protein
MALDPREVVCIKALFDAGAQTKALARAFGHDQRTIRKTIRHWTRSPLKEPPLYTQWQRGLPGETLTAIQRYFAQLSRHEHTVLHTLHTAAQATDDALGFPSQDVYNEILHTAQPQEILARSGTAPPGPSQYCAAGLCRVAGTHRVSAMARVTRCLISRALYVIVIVGYCAVCHM